MPLDDADFFMPALRHLPPLFACFAMLLSRYACRRAAITIDTARAISIDDCRLHDVIAAACAATIFRRYAAVYAAAASPLH